MFIFKFIPSRFFSLQARKPSGFFGRYLMTKIFNKGNADLNSFVKEVLDLQKSNAVLEIGFGPGKLINEMADVITGGIVEGIDFSHTMFRLASKINKKQISKGRVKLHKGDCTDLPFDNESFNKLCSINTLYFWKEPDNNLSEIFRVLKPGGKVAIGFRDDKQMSNLSLSKDVFNFYSQDDVVRLLTVAGFSNVHIREKEGVPFVSYCAVATKE